jgi:hypothetical protein
LTENRTSSIILRNGIPLPIKHVDDNVSSSSLSQQQTAIAGTAGRNQNKIPVMVVASMGKYLQEKLDWTHIITINTDLLPSDRTVSSYHGCDNCSTDYKIVGGPHPLSTSSTGPYRIAVARYSTGAPSSSRRINKQKRFTTDEMLGTRKGIFFSDKNELRIESCLVGGVHLVKTIIIENFYLAKNE